MYLQSQAPRSQGTERGLARADTQRIFLDMQHWYERAKRIMQAKGITQADLMQTLRVTSRGAVGHYLNGRRDPSPDQMAALAKALGVSMDELFGRAPRQEVVEGRGTYEIEPDWDLLRRLAATVDRVVRTHGEEITPEGAIDIARIFYRRLKDAPDTLPTTAEIVDLLEFAKRQREKEKAEDAPSLPRTRDRG